MREYQLSRPYSMGWHPASWVLRIYGSSPQVLRGTKTYLTRWLRERRGRLPFAVHLIVRADFGPLGGTDYVLLLDRPEDHIAVLAGPDGAPVEIDLRPRLDPDDVALRTRPASGGRAGLTVHSVRRRVVGSTVWTEAHCYPVEDQSDLWAVPRSVDTLILGSCMVRRKGFWWDVRHITLRSSVVTRSRWCAPRPARSRRSARNLA